MLTRADLLALCKPQIVAVPMPEFGDGKFVHIREFSGKIRQQFGAAIPEKATKGDLYRVACVFGICDADGNPIFTPDDVATLADLTPDAFDRLGQKIIDLNSTTPSAIDDAKKD